MKKLFYPLIFMLLVGSGSLAMAAEAKIGYMDLQTAITRSEKGKAARAKLNEMVEQKKSAIGKLASEIEEAQATLEKQGHLFTEEARQFRMFELDNKQRQYQRMASRFEEDLKWAEQELVEQLTREIRPLVEEVGKRDGFALILEYSPGRFLYTDKTLDVTDRVIELLNKKK